MSTQQTKAGEPDPSFNDGQPVYPDLRGFVQDQNGIAAGRDGLIYISGSKAPSAFGGPAEFFIAALDAQGRWHSGFGSGGMLVGSFFDTQETEVLVRSFSDALHYEQGLTADDDRLFLLGRYIYKKGNSPQSLYPAVACFRVDGSLDQAFGTDGICIVTGLEGDGAPSYALPTFWDSRGSKGDIFEAYVNSPLRWDVHDRRFYIVGWALDVPLTMIVVVDFSGAIDWNFGVDGVQKVGRESGFLAYDIVMAGDGIYLSGASGVQPQHHTVATSARLDYNGVLDTSFGEGGFKDFTWDGKAYFFSIAPLSTEYLVPAGYVPQENAGPMLLSHDLRGNANPDFNGGNAVVIRGAEGRFRRVAVEADEVIAVGDSTKGLLVARFLNDGQLDTSFAGGGWRVLTELSDAAQGRDMMVRPDRSIVIWGGHPGQSVVTVLSGQ